MISFVTDEQNWIFPPAEDADEDGLLLIGGKLTAAKVLEAYTKGIFPWYSKNEPVLWWSPDPRFVLFPDELHVSRSMEKVLRQHKFELRINTAFDEVITSCKTINRDGQDGTWITEEMQAVYSDLHRMGHAYSAEAWLDNELAGGVYGVRIGDVFCGESMFSKVNNASKFAFISYIRQLQKEGIRLIDCQVYTPHVETLGARLIPRKEFLKYLPASFDA